MNVVKANELLISSETDIRGGVIGIFGVNDAFDLYLVKLRSSGHYRIIIFMKIQFFFESGDGGKWTIAEKNKFVSDWTFAVKNTWGG